MSVKGLKAHTNRLKKLTQQIMVKEVSDGLFAGGERIQVKAQNLIVEGSVSGKYHVPSEKGQPPNNDTGVLAGNIEVIPVAPLVVHIESKAPYAAALQFGTSRMAARPYMDVARNAEIKNVQKIVQQAANRAVKKARSGDS